MKVGLMGGTFDPIHLGHLIAAESARESAHLDEVWFLPAHVPPHKTRQPTASAQERLIMAKLATEDHEQFRVSDLELHREGASYTVDTMNQLKDRHPDYEFYFIIGADMVVDLVNWHKIDELLELTRFIGLARPGMVKDWSVVPEHILARVQRADMPRIDISSTDLRARLKEKRSCRYLLHPNVERYIREKKLYE